MKTFHIKKSIIAAALAGAFVFPLSAVAYTIIQKFDSSMSAAPVYTRILAGYSPGRYNTHWQSSYHIQGWGDHTSPNVVIQINLGKEITNKNIFEIFGSNIRVHDLGPGETLSVEASAYNPKTSQFELNIIKNGAAVAKLNCSISLKSCG